MSADTPTQDTPPRWDSGVGGVQCALCSRTTVCRVIDGDFRCRPCWEGWDDDLDFEEYDEPDSALTDPCDFCEHGRPDHGGDGCDRCGCTWPL